MQRHCVTLILLLLLALTRAAAADLKTEMQRLQQAHAISFVYDAALDLSAEYRGKPLAGLPLEASLRQLFAHTSIIYKVDGNHVLLMQALPAAAPRRHTLSGYVTEPNGEPMINATVISLTTGEGTTTNEHGFYSLTLGEGTHRLRYSFVGYEPHLAMLPLLASQTRTVRLRPQSQQVGEVTVEGDLNSPVLTTQTGKRTLTPHDLRTEFSLLSSPDVIKTLQSLSGVAQGIELMSGLYVHGGGGDENLFLLDGTPLYQTNHLLGLFSSFNTDVIKNVDFYKSGFPARYGGRLSSVTDVRTADGDMQHWHGLYALGLIDGRLQAEGPLVKGRTSLNLGLRRTWMDLVTRPIFAIVNRQHRDDNVNLSYFFHDLNAKLTHIVDPHNTLQLSLYSGNDRFDVHSIYDEGYQYASDTRRHRDHEDTRGKYSWGNDNVSADWKHIFSPRLFAYTSLTYTHNRARYSYTDDDRTYYADELQSVLHEAHRYRSTIDDVSLRTDMDLRPSPRHHIRYGAAYAYHLFRPQTRSAVAYYGYAREGGIDTVRASSHNHQPAHELALYGEDELRLGGRWSMNAGLHADLFGISRKTYLTLDPRLAVKYQLGRSVSLKASYTWMTQQMHRLQNTYIDMPTDYWVPTTRRVPPMRSQQVSAGIYAQLRRQWVLQAEVYYKYSRHLLQYGSWIGLEPPADSWDLLVEDGQGRSAGLDLDLGYHSRRVTVAAAYTLSRTERRFAETYGGWFLDKFDNRHKLNLTARLHWRRSEMYAAWTFHTGNRITVPEHYAALPHLPDQANHRISEMFGAQFFYSTPNNATLPAYHRLDLGWNFRHTTKAGHERVWNVSLYNAYCRLNPLYTEIKETSDERFRVKSVGFVPVIPSVSYTIKW